MFDEMPFDPVPHALEGQTPKNGADSPLGGAVRASALGKWW